MTHPLLPLSAAPGQMSVSDLQAARLVAGLETKRTFFLFGAPISLSPSPTFHNTGRLPRQGRWWRCVDGCAQALSGVAYRMYMNAVRPRTFKKSRIPLVLLAACCCCVAPFFVFPLTSFHVNPNAAKSEFGGASVTIPLKVLLRVMPSLTCCPCAM